MNSILVRGNNLTTEFRDLPSVDRVLSNSRVKNFIDEYSHNTVLVLVRKTLDQARTAINNGHSPPSLDQVVEIVSNLVSCTWKQGPIRVINATGVIIHTNLGRSPLSQESLTAIGKASNGYSNLELDLETGKRGSRQNYLASLISQLTCAEAATTVNNNAAGVLLGLAALVQGKEIIISRGEAVEIGGGFRIPNVLRQSGSTLVEVGTTNRTYVKDYDQAITDMTGAILVVHPSNFRVSGFIHTPSLVDLVSLGNKKGIPVFHDLGSGCLLETKSFGMIHEPTPQESLSAGVSLTFFSGDKLLGGPQSGIIAGRQSLIDKITEHPLARALRLDKLSIAALTATMLHYVKEEAIEKVPVWRMIAQNNGDLKSRVEEWQYSLGPTTSVTSGYSTVGGGSLPGETLPTTLLSINPTGQYEGVEGLAKRLRLTEQPVIGRIEEDRFLLDPRTVLPEEDVTLLKAVKIAIQNGDATD